MENFKGYAVLVGFVAVALFCAHKLELRQNEQRKKDKLAQDIQVVNVTYTDCLVYAKSGYLSAVDLLLYQLENSFITATDSDNSVNYLEFVNSKADDKCLETKITALKKLGVN